MTSLPLAVGDTAWLVPKTLGAPSAAWSLPRVTVVSTPMSEWTVRLDSGELVTTHQDNVVRVRPTVRRPRPARPRPTPDSDPAPAWSDVPLW